MTLVFLLAFLGVGNVYEGRVVRVMLRPDSHTLSPCSLHADFDSAIAFNPL